MKKTLFLLGLLVLIFSNCYTQEYFKIPKNADFAFRVEQVGTTFFMLNEKPNYISEKQWRKPVVTKIGYLKFNKNKDLWVTNDTTFVFHKREAIKEIRSGRKRPDTDGHINITSWIIVEENINFKIWYFSEYTDPGYYDLLGIQRYVDGRIRIDTYRVVEINAGKTYQID